MSNILLRRKKLGRGSCNGIQVASTTGIFTVRNWIDQLPEETNFVFRWGCTSNVPEGASVVNSARSIHWCSDKRQSRLDMQAAGVPVPQSWDGDDWLDDSFSEDQLFVVRPSRHAQGRDLLVVNGYGINEVGVFLNNHESGYVARLINKVAEYRVFVCQNRAVWVAQKTPGNPDQVAWNVAQGGRFDNVRWGDWPLPVITASLAAAKVSGTDFCGVDVMIDAEGSPYVLEVNSAPSQTSAYRQQCVAKVFDHIVRNGKDHFNDVPAGPRRTWKSYIHPALRS